MQAGRWALSRVEGLSLAVAAGALVAAPWLEFSLYPLAWIAFAPLMLALARAASMREAIVFGWVAGMAANVPAFWWLVYTIDVFGGFPLPLAVGIYLCLSLFSAAQFALFAAGVFRLGPGPLLLAAPLLWVVLEFWYPNLFPWRMANSQLEWPKVMQVGDLTGPYGLSFVIVWFGAGLADVVRWRRWRPLAAATCAALLLWSYGSLRWSQIEASAAASPSLRVGLVQGNVGIREKGNAAYFDINIEKYRALSRALQDEVDVLIWPETVSHDWLDQRATHLAPREHPFPDLKTPLIFGGLGYHYVAADEPERYNAAFLVDADGAILGRYNKQILLPFGEYLPMASWIPGLKSISPNTGDFTPGAASVTLDIPGGARFAPLVCYEDVPAGIAREMTGIGANVLMTIFNDAWFGDSMAPYQHEAIAVWRAIENRRYFVRVGNAGDTGVVDPWGRVVERLPLFTADSLTATIHLLAVETFYTRYGDVFAWASTIAAVAWLLARRRSEGNASIAGAPT